MAGHAHAHVAPIDRASPGAEGVAEDSDAGSGSAIDEIDFSEIEMGSLIGGGSFGQVYQVLWLGS